jgi:hypothetical protein
VVDGGVFDVAVFDVGAEGAGYFPWEAGWEVIGDPEVDRAGVACGGGLEEVGAADVVD